MRFFLHHFIDLLFPPTCIRCQREGWWLCALCRNSLPKQCVSWCPVCCAEEKQPNHAHRKELGFDAIFSWLSYHTPWVERTIQDIKFGGLSSYAGVLGTELAARFSAFGMELSLCVITAIPLSTKRERERGFNQAEVLARALSKSSGVRYERLLQRNKPTKAQAKLSAEERFANVEDAFQLHMPRARGTLALSEKTIILVDDVVTTGATLSAASQALRSSGAKRIIALTVAYSDIRKELGKGG